jgi:aminotransferase (EC 2.6.1.-)
MQLRELFLRHNAQTSSAPLAISIEKANGVYLIDTDGKQYIDMISGISVSNLGHGRKEIIEAIQYQSGRYLHTMVYGELIQSPQTHYAKAITEHIAPNLNCVYFTNSGSEATEGAMKLAKRITQKAKIIAFDNSYHGSSQGALSTIGSEYWRNAYRPLLPEVYHYPYQSFEAVDAIDNHTAAVILELVQCEAGVIVPDKNWLQAIRTKCNQTGCQLIFDEIQTGFGRTGFLFRHTEIDVFPDILLLGKALGGGMPLGAFVSSYEKMKLLTDSPVLGHITTFGGHPVCCAAGLAAFELLQKELSAFDIPIKEKMIHSYLQHPSVKQINTCGMLAAIHFDSFETNKRIIDRCLQKGVFTDWFLFASHALRIAPPLTITIQELETALNIIIESIEEIYAESN